METKSRMTASGLAAEVSKLETINEEDAKYIHTSIIVL
jgi:hypothetical protein